MQGRRRQPRCQRRRHSGAEELRAEGLSGHGRSRQHAAARQAVAAGRDRHGAHFRCAHERHCVRHGRAARRARSGGGRQSGAGAERRHHRARRRAPPPASGSQRRRAEASALGVESRPRRRCRAVTPSCTSITCSKPTRVPTSTFWSAAAARPFRKTTTSSPMRNYCASRSCGSGAQRALARLRSSPLICK